jgi:O-antigen ligase
MSREARSVEDGAGVGAVVEAPSQPHARAGIATGALPAPASAGAQPEGRSGLTRLAGAVRRFCSGPYWVPALLLCGGFVLDPAWTSHPARSLREVTIGRLVLLAAGVAFATEAVRRRQRPRVPSLPAALLCTGLLGGAIVIGISAALHGSLRSQGSFGGYDEFVVIALLVLTLTAVAPRFAIALLLATAIGALLSDILALAGLQGGHFGGTSRLDGAFGNPNYLAFVTGLGISVMLGAVGYFAGRGRIAALCALPVMVATLALTYSRSGLIIAFVGALGAVAVMLSSRRARLILIGAATLAGVAGAVALYPTYQHLRLDSDFASQLAEGLPDRSGWDPSAQGFINGESKLSNPSPGVLEVRVGRPKGGVSYPFGSAVAGGSYRISLLVRTPHAATSVFVGMEDNYSANGPVITTVSGSASWRGATLTWRPTANSPHARFYVWAGASGTVLQLADVVETASVPSGPGGAPVSSSREIGTHLVGAFTSTQAFSSNESDFVRSRLDAAKLSIKLFGEHPLFGVGWEQYGNYAAAELAPGVNAGSTHDDYLRMLAELGIPGLLFLLTCIGALAVRFRRGNLSRAQLVAVGPLAAAAAGLFFITALETPAISLPLAVALGIVCAGAPPRVQKPPVNGI